MTTSAAIVKVILEAVSERSHVEITSSHASSQTEVDLVAESFTGVSDVLRSIVVVAAVVTVVTVIPVVVIAAELLDS